MPRPSKQQKASRNRKKNELGRFVSNIVNTSSIHDDGSNNINQQDGNINSITEEEVLNERDLMVGYHSEEYQEKLDADVSIASLSIKKSSHVTQVKDSAYNLGLYDNGSIGHKKRGTYQRKSNTTKWRRKKEAEKVNPKQTFNNFGFLLTNTLN